MTYTELVAGDNFYTGIPAKVIEEINKIYSTSSQYIGWLQKEGDEVIYRVWATRTTKKYGQEYREVIRAILGEEGVQYRDMYLISAAGGYKVVYRPSRSSSSNWYGYSYYSYDESDFGRWDWAKKVGITVDILNMDMLKDTKWKYSGYNGKGDFLEWMRVYKEYPQVELLGKLGYEASRKLLKKASNDKAFRTFLARNPYKEQNINAICYAYDHHMDVLEAGLLLDERASAGRAFKGRHILETAGIDKVKALRYVQKHRNERCNPYSYCDYIESCVELGLDMKDTKVIYPKEFRRMHDLRINEFGSKKDKIKSKKFKEAAMHYIQFEMDGKEFAIVIPKKIMDLKSEGNKLKHCVGRMGYDKKMIDGVSFIAFVRKIEEKDIPFVTVEYSIKDKKVLQCYGYKDSKPPKNVVDFVNKWSKEVKKAI